METIVARRRGERARVSAKGRRMRREEEEEVPLLEEVEEVSG